MAEDVPEKFFEFDLGDLGHSCRFTDAVELVAWCDRELAFWEWVRKVPAGSAFEGFYDSLVLGPNRIKTILGPKKGDRSAAETEQVKQQLEGAFQKFYCRKQSIHSSHPKVESITRLREEDPVAAVAMLATVTNFFDAKDGDFRFQSKSFSSVIHGVVENFFFDAELKGAAESQSKALSLLRQEYKEQLDQQADAIKSFELVVAQFRDVSQATSAEQSTRFENLYEGASRQLSESLTSATAKLEGYIESVKKRWALDQSVSYWKAKEKYHKDRTVYFGIICPVVGSLLTVGIFGLVWWLSGGLKTPSVQPNYWHIVVLVIAVTLTIWLLRILVRIFLSHLHRHADAHERITMIQTYLALLQEGKEIVPDDRKIIIQTIFRPATSGFVKDDGAPASPWEYASRKSS